MRLPQQVIDFIRLNPEAQLTGSWYFGTATPKSDFDFFMGRMPVLPDSMEVREDNMCLSYTPTDCNTTTVLSLYIAGAETPLIHVQIQQDVKAKAFVQEMIFRWIPTFGGLPKSSQKAIWQLAFRFLKTTW